jgi:hypothetical protein
VTDEQDRRDLRVFAHGGGVQSTAALVLSAQRKIDFPVHLFSNVGDQAEHPDTLAYVRDVSMPYAKAHGIELHEIRKVLRDGTPDDLYVRMTRPGSMSMPIPVRGADTGKPGGRGCTAEFKLRVIWKWNKAHGATEDNPAQVGIGITVDEIERAGRGQDEPGEVREYPLVDLGLHRNDCHRIITEAGLPTPPKSACYFCPFHRPRVWAEMRRDRPDLFEKAAALEDSLNERRPGKSPVYLTRFGRPLRECIGPAQATLFDASPDIDTCDEGVCFV